MPVLVKTTGSRGLHVYVPIVRGPTQKEVWTFAKAMAGECAAAPGAHHRGISGGEAAERARARGLQPERVGPDARIDLLGAPATAGAGVDAGDVDGARAGRGDRGFTVDTMPARLAEVGDLWKPLLQARGRFNLGTFL